MTTRSQLDGAELSTGQLVNAVKDDVSGMIRDEIELAKAEIREDVKSVSRGGALIAVAAVLVVLAVILLSVALAYGVAALGLAPGWSFLIVAGAYILIAGVLALVAKRSFASLNGASHTREAAEKALRSFRVSTER